MNRQKTDTSIVTASLEYGTEEGRPAQRVLLGLQKFMIILLEKTVRKSAQMAQAKQMIPNDWAKRSVVSPFAQCMERVGETFAAYWQTMTIGGVQQTKPEQLKCHS